MSINLSNECFVCWYADSVTQIPCKDNMSEILNFSRVGFNQKNSHIKNRVCHSMPLVYDKLTVKNADELFICQLNQTKFQNKNLIDEFFYVNCYDISSKAGQCIP